MNKKQRIFSAIQPSGELHIGNYVGALKNFIELQEKYDCFFFIADYHSLTENYNPKEKPKQIMDLALDFLAIGLDPEKCTIAVQSQIPEHTELTWIFNTVTAVSELKRMTQFKDKSRQQKENINMGLFDYPVLQAADILIYKADLVPVGQDQLQHIELTRRIARSFNNRFGSTFPEPKALLTKTPKLMSLINPLKKMSKSGGRKSYIGINDSPQVIRDKIRKAVSATDIKSLPYFDRIAANTGENGYARNMADEKIPSEELKMIYGVLNLKLLLENFGTQQHKEYFGERFKKKDVKFSELKEVLAEDIADYFAPFREKRKKLEANPGYVKKVLTRGAQMARIIAQETMKEVKTKVGLVIDK